jgi:2-oxoglutarate dehydrogenase E2 component (dihydrolipoamide succinyltransferase)
MAAEIAEIKVPAVGESITEVIVSEWLKPEGAWVEKDEPLVTLETDKVNVDVPAPAAGVLAKILKGKESTALVGEVIARIEQNGKKAVAAGKASEALAKEGPAPAVSASVTKTVMPAAERLASERGVNTSDIQGTGPGGRVLKEDVQRQLSIQTSTPESVAVKPAAVSSSRQTEVVRMTPLSRKIAERLVHAQQTAALLTTFNEIDMTAVMALRSRYKDAFQNKYGIKLGFMSFFVKAAIEALKAYPEINARIDGDDIVYHNYYDVGVAVDSDRGLVVPVIRNAELMSFAEIELAISEFGKRAKDGKLKLEELQGGTFTISNGGVFGSLMSTPIINPPQSGILGMHAIVERPIGVNGQVVLRPMMYIAMTYDHRIVDGRGAVSFLKRIKECVESPDRMLLEI